MCIKMKRKVGKGRWCKKWLEDRNSSCVWQRQRPGMVGETPGTTFARQLVPVAGHDWRACLGVWTGPKSYASWMSRSVLLKVSF